MANPLISVCINTYDRPELLEEALFCFLHQDYENKELIILNDRPEQNLIFEHPQVKIVNRKERFTNSGEKRKACVALSSGEYLQFWDDDDIHLPWHMKDCIHRLQYFKNKNMSRSSHYWKNINTHRYILNISSWVHTLTIKKDVYWEVGGHDNVTRNEDKSLIVKLLRSGKLAHYKFPMMKPSFIYNVDTGRMRISNSVKGEQPAHAERWQRIKDEADYRNVTGDILLKPHWNNDYVAKSEDAWEALYGNV